MSTMPVFSAVGTGHDTAPAWPTHATGDFGLLCCESATDDIPTPSGWNLIGSWLQPFTATCLTLFWKIATSSSETAPAISSAGDHSFGVIYTATGVNSINPIHSLSPHFTPNRTGKTDAAGLTTNLDKCLVLAIFSRHSDSSAALASLPSNGQLASPGVAIQYDGGTTTNNGGGITIIDGGLALKGTIGPTSVTYSSGVASAVATLALQAAGESYGIKSQIVNKGDSGMPIQVKQSTAQTIGVWMADSADGKTGKTGLTLTVLLKKYGAVVFTDVTSGVTVTEIGNGHYDILLSTTHMNTIGVCSLRATSTGADPADCPNIVEVVGYDKTDATGLGLSLITTNINATISSRATQTSLDTVDDFLDTEIAAIKAKTDNLPSDPADASDIATLFATAASTQATLNTKLDTIDDFLDTEIAAIKAKTDNLPSDPADASDIATAFTGVNTKLDTIDDFLDTEIAAIKAKTDNLPSDPADASVVAGLIAAVDAKIDLIDANTDLIPVIGGLMHLNSKIDKTVYVTGFMTQARLRVFADAAALAAAVAVDPADDAEGEIYRFEIRGVDEGDGTLKSYTLSRTL